MYGLCLYFVFMVIGQKNLKDKIIVIYDYDEKVACPMGNLFFEKGFDNVYVLSGGLQLMAESFPQLLVGEPPVPPRTPKAPVKQLSTASSSSPSTTSGSKSGSTTARSTASSTSSSIGHTSRSNAMRMSTASTSSMKSTTSKSNPVFRP